MRLCYLYLFLLFIFSYFIINLESYSITTTNEKYLIYENGNLGIKIPYPYNWKINNGSYFDSPESGATYVIKFYPPVKTAIHYEKQDILPNEENSFIIKILESPNKPLYKAVRDEIESSDYDIKNFNLTHFDYNSTIGNTLAYKVIFSYIAKQLEPNEISSKPKEYYKTPFKTLILITKIGNKIFIIKYNCQIDQYSVFLPNVMKMINSLAFAKENNVEKVNTYNVPQYALGNYTNVNNIVVNTTTNKIYIPQQNYVSVINGLTYKEESRIRIDNFTGSISTIDQYNDKIYFADPKNKKIAVIDGKNNRISYLTNNTLSNTSIFQKFILKDNLVTSIPLTIPSSPNGRIFDMAVDGISDILFVGIDDKVYVLKHPFHPVSITDYQIVGNITLPSLVDSLDVDPITDRLFAGVMNQDINIIYYKSYPFSYKVTDNIRVFTNYGDLDILKFNSKTNLLITSGFSTISSFIIDAITKNITELNMRNFIGGITIDPINNRIYMTNPASNSVSVIDILKKRIDGIIPVGSNPGPIGINLNTNTIYVFNRGSNSITQIDGSTDKVVAKVVFNISPPNAGYVECSGKKYPTNQYLEIEFGIKCTAESNSNFQFSNWVKDLGDNSTKTVTSYANSYNSPFESFLKIFGFMTGNNAKTFSLTDHGNFTANFRSLPPPIPQENLIGLYTLAATVFTGWFVPNIARWFNSTMQKRHIMQYLSELNDIEKNNNSYLKLEDLKKRITYSYAKSKIGEEHYKLLSKKISDLESNKENI